MEERKDICEGYERDSVQQLDKLAKDKNERFPIYPLTYIQAVYDARTKERLDSILWKCNNVYLPWMGSAGDTRIQLPFWMRRKGIIITYKNLDDETITEKLTYDLCIADDFFRLDSSWTRITDALPVGGNITIGSNGNWFQDGVDSGFKAQGPKGDNGLIPMLRTVNNKLQYSYDGEVWNEISEYIAAWFRYQDNKIQISRDQKTWSDLSKPFTQDLYIKGYVATSSALPSTGVKQGDIYMVGPTYAVEDTEHKNPIYRMYVYNDSGWVDNGVFQSIAAGVVQTIGNSETEVMSQKAVSSIVGLDTYPVFSDTKPYVKGDIVNYGGLLYEFTADHEAGAWIGTDARETSLRDELLKIDIDNCSYSGHIPIYRNFLYSSVDQIGEIVADDDWDCAMLNIYNSTGKLEVEGAVPAFFFWFDEPRIKKDNISNTTGIIPNGTKYCVIDFKKIENPNGYDNLRVRQYGSGTDYNEFIELNSFSAQAFSDLYTMACKFEDQDITSSASLTEGAFYDIYSMAMKDNVNYRCYKVDVSGYIGNVLSIQTNIYNDLYGIIITDINNNKIAAFDYHKTSISKVNRNIYITSKMKYLYVNDFIGTGYNDVYIKTAKTEELNSNYNDILPVNLKMRDAASYISYPLLIRDHATELSIESIIGDIFPSANFDISVVKLLSKNKLIVRNVPVFRFVYYSSSDLSKETYIGHNITGEYIDGAKYCVLLFRKIDLSYKLSYDDVFVEQCGSITKIDSVIRKKLKEELIPASTVVGKFILDNGTEKENQYFRYERYDIQIEKYSCFTFTGWYGESTDISVCHFYDANDTYLGNAISFDATPGGVNFTDETIPILKNTSYMLVNVDVRKKGVVNGVNFGNYYDFEEIEKNVRSNDCQKLIKLHLYGTEPTAGSKVFYLRSRYNETKDILLVYYINNNFLVSPHSAYVGMNTLSDENLMKSENLFSSHDDSTAPIFESSLYWHLFAQHGYVIPVVDNTVGLTASDIGALWKDQLDRQYNIGNIIGSSIYLLPVITRGTEGNDSRGWKTPNNTAITSLTHVSGGDVTTPIMVSKQRTTQLYPIMKHENRKFYMDGKELSEPGDYSGNDFTVSESQIGYDPATITSWFPTLGVKNNVDLTDALEMARFTWSYNFKGAQCCVNTTIDIRRKVECRSYGACQQQTFIDTDNYKAMIMIPKAKAQNGIELDKPFNSPTTTSPFYYFWRNSSYLKNVDDQIDRLIAFLHNPNDNTYLAGMAAGLSLVSGDTIPEKRNINIPISESDELHHRLGHLSPGQRNKFYIAAINTSPFEDDGYNLPNTYFKEINYYVSYFDPSDNVGQVYWYKDGNIYVIYMHCQTEKDRISINLPDFMEGLKVEIVEKTEGATLHTTVVQNGKLYVSYTNDANYIVVKTK